MKLFTQYQTPTLQTLSWRLGMCTACVSGPCLLLPPKFEKNMPKILNYSDIVWVSWRVTCLKSPTVQIFIHRLFRLTGKKTSKVRITAWSLVHGVPVLLALCASPVNSPHKGQWRGALIFFFDLRLNKRLSKQWWGWCAYATLKMTYSGRLFHLPKSAGCHVKSLILVRLCRLAWIARIQGFRLYVGALHRHVIGDWPDSAWGLLRHWRQAISNHHADWLNIICMLSYSISIALQPLNKLCSEYVIGVFVFLQR